MKSEVDIAELDLIPADGRDYLSGETARKDWNKEVEFTVQTARKSDGSTVNLLLKRVTRAVAVELGIHNVGIRFNAGNGYRSFIRVKAPTDEWV
jgi:hypothetical protein